MRVFVINKTNPRYKDCCGVYIIQNTTDNKIYVGSAANLYHRYMVHISTLSRNIHHNSRLQRAYNKHGAQSFIFIPVIITTRDQVREYEQQCIDFYWGPNCYNATPSVEPMALNNRHIKTVTLVSPQDRLVTFTGTNRSIAEQVNANTNNPPLNKSTEICISQLLKEKRLHWRGWRLPDNRHVVWNTPKLVNYHHKFFDIKLRGPDGAIHGPIHNLAKFCREHDIKNHSLLHNLISGRTRYANGWSLADYDIPIAKNAKEYNIALIDPTGNSHQLIANLTKFAKDHGLTKSGLQHLLWKKQKTHRGWMLAPSHFLSG